MVAPDWMPQAQRAAFSLQAETRGQAGAGHSVYVVLLRDPRRVDPWGLYVGQAARDPDWRFDQYKAGYKASGAVKRCGVCLLPALTEHLNPMQQWESIELEAGLAEAFRHAGLQWIEGGH